MSDVVVTVPKGLWEDWLAEGNLAGDPWDEISVNHFWIPRSPLPDINPGERVYIVAHGKLRGYAPLVAIERSCRLARNRACLQRFNGAMAVTIDEPIIGFRGWRYRWWEEEQERPFPDWMTP